MLIVKHSPISGILMVLSQLLICVNNILIYISKIFKVNFRYPTSHIVFTYENVNTHINWSHEKIINLKTIVKHTENEVKILYVFFRYS